MKILVWSPGILSFQEQSLRCALGRGGIVADKKEGDGGTPVGDFPLRRVFYRPDRLSVPETKLTVQPLGPDDGWCDDPNDSAYNQLVKTPFAACHETLWRDDGIYDVLVELGYNDDPVRPGKGSAIFMHVTRQGYLPTEGCVALGQDDLLALLKKSDEKTRLHVLTEPPAQI